jgi:hypothetical protein
MCTSCYGGDIETIFRLGPNTFLSFPEIILTVNIYLYECVLENFTLPQLVQGEVEIS